MAKPQTKRTYVISSSVIPSISGYGGFDEWEVNDLTNTRADRFLQELQKLVEKYGGRFTGSN